MGCVLLIQAHYNFVDGIYGMTKLSYCCVLNNFFLSFFVYYMGILDASSKRKKKKAEAIITKK